MSVKSSTDLISQIFGTISQYILSVIKYSGNYKDKITLQEVYYLHNFKENNEDKVLDQCASSAMRNPQ